MTPPYFYIFVIISPLKRNWPFIWTNLNSLHPRIISTKFDWIWSAGSKEEDFLEFSAHFHPFVLPWRGAIPFFSTYLNPLPPRMICAKSGRNWPAGSGEEYLLKIFSVFLLFRYYLPLERGNSLHLNKLESPPPQGNLYQRAPLTSSLSPLLWSKK
jgi:hypothetical protein